MVHGWLRDTEAATPRHVRVTHGRRLAAEALASEFRLDLLLAGHGHGHHGFHARLKIPLPEGTTRMDLHLPAKAWRLTAAVVVPPLEAPRPTTVETLLHQAPGWTVAQLLMRPDCLDLRAHYAAMSTPRFVDAVFRFALDRWPSPAEARLHAGALQAGRIGPEALLVECLSGRERADMPPGLRSPYDPEFPFA